MAGETAEENAAVPGVQKNETLRFQDVLDNAVKYISRIADNVDGFKESVPTTFTSNSDSYTQRLTREPPPGRYAENPAAPITFTQVRTSAPIQTVSSVDVIDGLKSWMTKFGMSSDRFENTAPTGKELAYLMSIVAAYCREGLVRVVSNKLVIPGGNSDGGKSCTIFQVPDAGSVRGLNYLGTGNEIASHFISDDSRKAITAQEVQSLLELLIYSMARINTMVLNYRIDITSCSCSSSSSSSSSCSSSSSMFVAFINLRR